MIFRMPNGSVEIVTMIGFAYNPNALYRKKGRRVISTDKRFDVDLCGAKYIGFAQRLKQYENSQGVCKYD